MPDEGPWTAYQQQAQPVEHPANEAQGMTLNNPGNLRGTSGEGFNYYPDMPSGVAANVRQLLINQDTHNKHTIRDQVTHWVHEPGADLKSYIDDVSRGVGVDPDEPVDFHNPQVAERYMLAMQPHESGPTRLNPEHVKAGVRMALGGQDEAAGPWTAYQKPAAPAAPWTAYQKPAAPATPWTAYQKPVAPLGTDVQLLPSGAGTSGLERQSHTDYRQLPMAQKEGEPGPGEPTDTGWWGALTGGLGSAVRGAGQTAQALTGGKPVVSPPTTKAAEPIEWSDVTRPGLLGRKFVYGLAASAPEIAGFGVGAALGGGPETPVGLLAGAAGAALTHAATSLGPAFGQELQASPQDPDGAFKRAMEQTGVGSLFTGAGFAAFGIAPFEGALKNLVFQAFGVQPGMAVAQQAAENVTAGRPVGENVTQGVPGAVLMTAAPMAAHAVAGRLRGRDTTIEQPPPETADNRREPPETPPPSPPEGMAGLYPGGEGTAEAERLRAAQAKTYAPANFEQAALGELPPQRGAVFASPNIAENLDFPQAVAGLQTDRQRAFAAASNEIDAGLGLQTKAAASAVGAWSDGAENSTLTEVEGGTWEQLRAAAAMKGALGQQKAALVFQEDPEEGSVLSSFRATGDLADIHRNLLNDGVEFHTIVPTEDGAMVYVADLDGSAGNAVKQAAERYGQEPVFQKGRAEFVGTEKQDGTDEEQRADARAVYSRVLQESGVPGASLLWERLHNAYGEALGLAPAETTGEPLFAKRQQEPPTPKRPEQIEAGLRNLSVLDILHPDTPAIPARTRRVGDIAGDLMTRGQTALKALGIKTGRIEGPEPTTDDYIARTMAAEVKGALERDGNNASDWYTHKVREAMAAAATLHPEVATDPNARMAFTAALAITSQGETVPSNVRLAEPAYNYFKQNGRFPTNIEAKQKGSMNANFAKLNALIDTVGVDGLRDFLHRERTVKEFEDEGHAIGGENKQTRVYGSAILGAKIGQGFFQNLNENYNPVTMDLWFMRLWGRMTGTLVGGSPEARVNQRTRLENALRAAAMPVPKSAAGMLKVAERIFDAHEKHFAKNRAAYNAGELKKSELTYAAERYVHGVKGINETPSSGGDRTWMRSVVARAREILESQGLKVTPADLQAILWYPEKDLYDKLGGRDSEGINADYSSAIADLARSRGVSDEAIARAVGALDQRPGPAGEANVAQATQGVGAERGEAGGEGEAGRAGPEPAGPDLQASIRQRGEEAGAPHPDAMQAVADAVHEMLGGKARVEVHANEEGSGLAVRLPGGRVERVNGVAVGRIIRVAMGTLEDTAHYLNHEAIHVMRNMGVFTPGEWRTLLRTAEREKWADEPSIGGPKTIRELYSGLSPERLLEEGIAERFAKTMADPGMVGRVPFFQRVVTKMVQFFQRIQNALTGNGFRTADDVFGAVERGEVGAREIGAGMETRGSMEEPQFARGQPRPPDDRLRDMQGAARILGEVKAGLAPTSLRGAKAMEYAIREHTSRSAQMGDITNHKLDDAVRTIDRLDQQQQIESADRFEHGDPQTDVPQAAVIAVRARTDEITRKIQGLGKGFLANAIDNYMGRIYSNYDEWRNGNVQPTTQAQVMVAAIARNVRKMPLTGPATFLKKRFFPTQLEAINAGLTPVTYNWVRMHLIKLHEMEKFYNGHMLAQRIKDDGLARWVRQPDEHAAMAAGEVKLDDKIFQPKLYGVTPIGPVEPGAWYAPEPAARIFNNYMSEGWANHSKIYDAIRSSNNGLNSLQLGIGGFHAAFVTNDVATSKVALGLQQIARGEIGRGGANLLFGVPFLGHAAAITDSLIKGGRVKRAWLDPDNAPPDMKPILKGFRAAGYRMTMPDFFSTSGAGAFFKSWNDLKDPTSAWRQAVQMYRDTPTLTQKALVLPIRIAARTLDTVMEPLMGALVPRAKAGVMYDLTADWLRRNPNASPLELSAAMTKFQDTVDNRLGQMNYDNVFWHKTLKDLAFISMRSVGWNVGTVREIGGGVVDSAKFAADMAKGQKPEFSTRMAYTMAMPIVTGMLGASLTYLATGQGPQSLLDYFYPPTGGLDEQGSADRRSIPGYMKDVVAFWHDPVQTVINKQAPLPSSVSQLAQGKDYYGRLIYNPMRDDNQFQAYGNFLLNQAQPFSFRGMAKLQAEGAGPLDIAMGFFGFQPAPGHLVHPEKEDAFRLREQKKDVRSSAKAEAKGMFWRPLGGSASRLQSQP